MILKASFSRYCFASQSEAMSNLSERFPEWDGVQTPHTNSEIPETLVVVSEPPQLDEEGEPLPPAWVGFHVDLCLYSEFESIDKFRIEPEDPVHSF